MNIDQDPARMIDCTEDRTGIDRKRALVVVALAAIVSVGCGKHRGYDAPDAGGDDSAEAGSDAPKTSASHTNAANGGGRAPVTGAAGRQSTGAAGRSGNTTGSRRAAAGSGAAGHSASGSPKGGDGGDTSSEPQNAGGATASGGTNSPAADGGSGGSNSAAGDGAAGTSAGAGGAADGGDTSLGGAGAAGSTEVAAGGAGAGATGDVGGAGAGGAGAGGAGAGGAGSGGADNAAGAGAGGAGKGGMSGGDSGGAPAAGSGGSGAMCQRDRDCGEGLICDATSSSCQHCSSDSDCQMHRGYGAGYTCSPDTRLCIGSGLCASCGGCEEVQTPNPDTHHTDDPIDYPDPPPTSGPHNPCWATWGVHDMPVPDYRWVHNLEHGGIVYLYNCPDGCADDVATLTQLVMSHPRTVLTSYAKLPTRFAAVAWGHRLLTSCVDVTAFTTFYTENFDHSPESEDAQPDSSCPP